MEPQLFRRSQSNNVHTSPTDKVKVCFIRVTFSSQKGTAFVFHFKIPSAHVSNVQLSQAAE